MSLVPVQVRALSWMSAVLAAVGVAAALAGCVSSGGRVSPRSVNDGRDIPTESDQTDADRRLKVRLELASAYFARGQPTDALDEVKQALAASPNNAAAFGLRGLIYAALGDAATAEDSFHHSLQIAPGDSDTRHNFAWFLCQQRRYPEADAQFAQTLADRNYRGAPRTLLAQGVCQARAGQLADAERTLSRSYELDPSSPTTAVNLAEVLYQRAQYERARFYIRRVNTKEDLMSAQTLWLGARIEHKLGQDGQVADLGAQLHKRYPNAPETASFDKGGFGE